MLYPDAVVRPKAEDVSHVKDEQKTINPRHRHVQYFVQKQGDVAKIDHHDDRYWGSRLSYVGKASYHHKYNLLCFVS